MANQSDLGKAFFKESAPGSLKRPQTRGGSSADAPNGLPSLRRPSELGGIMHTPYLHPICHQTPNFIPLCICFGTSSRMLNAKRGFHQVVSELWSSMHP
ncbi:hypothetical protein LR48_Vigan08g022700 [Vigna angularis]|uniref:Uncharacterized protein n=1 Tax=Phaseolus angularis TaxID=3914 RepID=A0A0L9V2S6_PHAAN|nr:hypothetical protein LR48_Vigan08g022700 [Vigna angularis]